MLNVLLFVFFGFSSHLIAGTETGNGGDVLVCPNRIELLDFYEAEIRHEKLIKDSGVNEWVIAEKILQRLHKNNPTRSRVYLEGLKNFQAEIEFTEKQELPDIPDQGDIPIPRGCELKQIVIQAPPKIPDDYSNWKTVQPNRYKIDLNLWLKLSPNQKAGLITHELLLREAIHTLKHTHSKHVRSVNVFWWKEDFQEEKNSDYDKTMKLNHFLYTDLVFGDFTIFSNPIAFQTVYIEDESFIQISPAGNALTFYKMQPVIAEYIKLDHNNNVIEAAISRDGQPLTIPNTNLRLYDLIQFEKDLIISFLDTPQLVQWQGGHMKVYDKVKIDTSGKLIEGILAESHRIKDLTYNLSLRRNSYIHFYSNGKLKYVSSAAGVVKGVGPNDYFIGEHVRILFDSQFERVQDIEGLFRGYIQSECFSSPAEIQGRFTYDIWGTYIKRFSTPRQCEGNDGIIYEVPNDIIYDSCLILIGDDLPIRAKPCRLKP